MTAPAVVVLASRSASRQAMLKAAGVHFRAIPAPIDERAVEHALGDAAPQVIARELAQAKALAIGDVAADTLVLGSDSLVTCGGRRFDKPQDRDDAACHLRFFSGRTMELHSSAALVRAGAVLWSVAAAASLHIRDLSDAFIESYLDEEWPAVAGCVGVFRIEGPGVQLFHRIDGDYFTILGMPLLAVLGALRQYGGMDGGITGGPTRMEAR